MTSISINESAFKPDLITIIGAGGSGSRVITEMAPFLRGHYRALPSTSLRVVDYDVLSESNFARQYYYPFESLGKPKGQIMVERLNGLIPISQIPEPVNGDTIHNIFSEEILAKKNLVLVTADNFLVAKQVYEKLASSATNDWLWIFTGARLRESQIPGISRMTTSGHGQAIAYGEVRGVPLYPIKPPELIPDVFAAEGFGPNTDSQGCGVSSDSGAQTPLMNLSCCLCVMQLLCQYFENGIFRPSIYFIDGQSFVFGDATDVAELYQTEIPEEQSNEENQDSSTDTTPQESTQPITDTVEQEEVPF